jgi:hypothetical protein
MMKISLYVVCAAAFLTSGAVAADEDTVVADEVPTESTPIELSVAQMDQITAGTLLLPNGKSQFAGFDNPAPNVPGYLGEAGDLCGVLPDGAFCHPALNRRSDTAFVTAGKSPQVGGNGNDGPWAATVASPVISCPDCP